MSREIFDYLKRERDICVKTIIPSQNTAFMLTPASRRFEGNSSCSYCEANRCEEIKSRNENSNFMAFLEEMNSCESKKCLPPGRQSAFHLLFKVSRIDEVVGGSSCGWTGEGGTLQGLGISVSE